MTLNRQWHGLDVIELFQEFERFNAGNGIGPLINQAIDKGLTLNKGRSPFHVGILRKKFYHDLATDYVSRLLQSEYSSTS